MSSGPWRLYKEDKELAKRNSHKRESYRLIREETPEQRFEREQLSLWHKLHSVLTHREFITYEELPDKLKEIIAPFDEEYIYPTSI
jgi:hypothetical protein